MKLVALCWILALFFWIICSALKKYSWLVALKATLHVKLWHSATKKVSFKNIWNRTYNFRYNIFLMDFVVMPKILGNCSMNFISKSAKQEKSGFTSLFCLKLVCIQIYQKFKSLDYILLLSKKRKTNKNKIQKVKHYSHCSVYVYQKIISLPQIDFQNVNLFTKMLFLYHLTGSIMTMTFWKYYS